MSRPLLILLLAASFGRQAEAQPAVLVAAEPPSGEVLLHPERSAGVRAARAPHYVRLDAAALRAAVSAASRGVPAAITIEMASGKSIQSEVVWTEERGAERLTWSGTVVGDPEGHVLLSVEGRGVAGRIATGGVVYGIGYAGGGRQALYEVEPVGPESYCATEEAAPGVPPGAEDVGKASGRRRGGSIDTVRVLIAYTSEVRERVGADGLDALLQGVIDSANDVLVRTEVDGRLALGFAGEVPTPDSIGVPTWALLLALQTFGDGAFDEVHAWRSEHTTPVVSLLTERLDFCGAALAPHALAPGIWNSLFSVVRRGCAVPNYSFAHEVGHNFGLRHDPYTDPNGGLFPFAHGYTNLANTPGEAFRTVMAYADQCADADVDCPRVPYFSNPALTLNGYPVGEADVSDAARALRLSIPFIVDQVIPPGAPDFHVRTRENEAFTLTPDVSARILRTTDPEHGAVLIVREGTALRYRPNQDYYGPDSFAYFVPKEGFVVSGTVYVEVGPVIGPPDPGPDPPDPPDPPLRSSITYPENAYMLDLNDGEEWFDVGWTELRSAEDSVALEATWEFGFIRGHNHHELAIPAGDTTALRIATAALEEFLIRGRVQAGELVSGYHRVVVSDGENATHGTPRALYVRRSNPREEEVEEEEEPEEVVLFDPSLRAAYPNPTRGVFTLEVGVPTEQEVRVAFYDVTGRPVRVDRPALDRGYNTLAFDLGSLPAGVYLYTVDVASTIFRGRVVVL